MDSERVKIGKYKTINQPLRLYLATAFSILVFTESTHSRAFFLKKKTPLMQFQCQHVNRKCSNACHRPSGMASFTRSPFGARPRKRVLCVATPLSSEMGSTIFFASRIRPFKLISSRHLRDIATVAPF
jgi:hypothetical protein